MTTFFHREGVDKFFGDVRGVVRPLPELILGDTRPAVIAFAAAACLLLLITCVNVANLLLVRGLARIRDVAIVGVRREPVRSHPAAYGERNTPISAAR